MSGSPIVEAIAARLTEANYVDLATPLRVAGVEFSFTRAMRGQDGRALDLVLLVDTTTGDFGDRDATRVLQRIEALSRALDVTGSRFVVTVILAGAVLMDGIEALSETCRVLQVDNVALDDLGRPVDQAAKRKLDDRIRLLLPLTIPDQLVEPEGGSGLAVDQLLRFLPKEQDMTLVNAVVAASLDGQQAVTDAVALLIGTALQIPEAGEPA